MIITERSGLNLSTIGERIKEIRKDSGKSQRDFASSIKIGQSTLAMFENGQREPKDIHIEQICLKYGISEDWLRYEKPPKSANGRYTNNLTKLAASDDKTIMNWINTIAETNPEMLKEIEEFMKKLLGIDA